jgi:hypothetical protein
MVKLKGLHTRCNPICVKNSCKRGSCSVTLCANSEAVDCDICKCFPLDARSIGEDYGLIDPGIRNKSPDYIVVCYESDEKLGSWVIVDFKGDVSHVGGIVKQLQLGAIAVEKLPEFRIDNYPQELIGLIVKEGGVSHAADLARRSIRFKNRPKPVFVKDCGFSLKVLLKNKS